MRRIKLESGASFEIKNPRTCFVIARSWELGACKLLPRDGDATVKRTTCHGFEKAGTCVLPSFSISFGVSWGELTSSKL